MREIIEQWILKWKRAGCVDRAFLAAALILAAPASFKKWIAGLYPDVGAKLVSYGWLGRNFQWICLAAVVLLLGYAV
jgi:hypothetical protein